jgi:CubicO group peptidase (beta-lactamase class C family)
MRIIFLITFISLTFGLTTSKSQDLYFPPISSAATWDTISPSSLGWCLNKVDNLYDYLEQTDTKGFIVLKDGKIVLEKYFGTFTKDSLWYWASAGKTITSFLVGKAQEENYLSITDTSSKYLGVGWTNCTSTQEDKIKIRNQLTMTSGLDDGVPNNHCTLDTCLNYLANAGTRWAYHNAPYTLLESVITKATGNPINAYTQTKLKTKTGMTGAWAYVDYDNVFFSKVRSMARFGLLMQNNCIWNNDTLLHDTSYVQQMTNTSQSLNLSYGYLWWLNGKSSYMLPTSQIVFPGSYAPAAPSDMFAGLGKNGQILSVSKSLGLVVVRMGNQVTGAEVPTQLCNSIWEKLNAVMCNSTSINEINSSRNTISIFPNPTYTEINIIDSSAESFQLELINANGQIIMKEQNKSKIDISNLNNGLFYINIKKGQLNYIYKVIKQ